MPHPRLVPFSAARLDEALRFVAEAPLVDLATARRVVTELVRGPEAVFDLCAGTRRVAIGALIDTCVGPEGVAELLLLRAPADPTADLAPIVDAGIALAATGPARALELAMVHPLPSLQELLVARGFTCAFRLRLMERPPGPHAAPPPPPPLTFRRARPEEAEAYHRALVAILSGTPGALVPSPEALAQDMARPVPLRELLVDDAGAIAGVVTVALDAPGDRGEVRLIGRVPARRGRGLGPVLLGRALTLLEAERRPVSLEVAAGNVPAVALYEGAGFAITREVPVFRRPL